MIRKIAVALSVSVDELIFDENERSPQDDLRLQFEAVSKFSAEEKRVIKSVRREAMPLFLIIFFQDLLLSRLSQRPRYAPHRCGLRR